MIKPRVYDEHGRLQCKSCTQFLERSAYYQHNSLTGKYKNLPDHVCKRCQRTSEVGKKSRATARKKYADNLVFRENQIWKATIRYWEKRHYINSRKRAITIAKKYARKINKAQKERKTSSE